MKLNKPVNTFDMNGAPMRVTPKAWHGIHFAVIERPPGHVVAEPCFARHQLEAYIASLPKTEDKTADPADMLCAVIERVRRSLGDLTYPLTNPQEMP